MYTNNNNIKLRNCNNSSFGGDGGGGGKMPIASQTQRLGEAETKNLKGARECIARHFVAFATATKECKWQRLTSNLRTQSKPHIQRHAPWGIYVQKDIHIWRLFVQQASRPKNNTIQQVDGCRLTSKTLREPWPKPLHLAD